MSRLKTYRLQNRNGVAVEFLNYGGIVTKILTPNHLGNFENIVLGFDNPEQYLKANPPYYGALVGRVANRIGGAKFAIDGRDYELAKNDGGKHALHGGLKGFDKVFWEVDEVQPGKIATLKYLSADMEEGYPGNLSVEVRYSLNDQDEFSIEYKATTDKATHVNLTSHSYFNLSGDLKSTMLDHNLEIDADRFTVSDAEYIPTGEIREVSGAVDFRKPRKVGERIDEFHDGYNHNYILNKPGARNVAARVFHEKSGRILEILTSEPGLQFYSGYYLDTRYNGLALEAQHYPDSPNKSNFPSTLLKPGETYRQVTVHRFLS